MTTFYLIPLTNIPQDFDITLSGTQLRVVCKWNDYCGWLVDLYDGITQEPLIMAMPLVTGCDLLHQYSYLGDNGVAFVFTNGDQYAPPTLDNLGTESNLYLAVEL